MPTTSTEPRPSALVDFADLIVEVLNGRVWSQPLTASRTWLPTFDLGDVLDALRVNVVPRSLTTTPANRSTDWHAPVCEVGIMRKPRLDVVDALPTATREALLDREADRHSGLVEEIGDWFRSRAGRLYRGVGERYDTWHVDTVEVPTVMLLEHLHELGQLTSVIRLTGQVQR